MTFLIVLVLSGLSAGLIGRLKGGSFFIWFLIGFCLPFIGGLAALAMRRERDELRRRCENCHAVVPLHDQVCVGCGQDLDFPSEALAPRPLNR